MASTMIEPRHKASIWKGEDPREMVKKTIDLIGGIESFVNMGDKVLIKPNLCTLKKADTGATTDPEVVRGIIDLVQRQTDDVAIIESDCPAIDAEIIWSHCGYTDLAKEMDVELLNLSKEPILKHERYALPQMFFKDHVLINVPKMKTNDITVVSCSLKNLFGLIPNRYRAKYHKEIDKVILDINLVFGSDLIVVDGLTGMEGDGPINGLPVEMNLVIAGDNPVAIDSVVCNLMGVDPIEIDHIRMASDANLGPIDIHSIDLFGEEIGDVKKDFTLPSTVLLKQKIKYKLLEHSENFFLKQAIDTLGWIRRKKSSLKDMV